MPEGYTTAEDMLKEQVEAEVRARQEAEARHAAEVEEAKRQRETSIRAQLDDFIDKYSYLRSNGVDETNAGITARKVIRLHQTPQVCGISPF